MTLFLTVAMGDSRNPCNRVTSLIRGTFYVKCVLKSIEYNKKSIYERENKLKRLIENKLPQIFICKLKKKNLKILKSNLTVFFSDLYKTYAIPPSHTTWGNIKGSKIYLKDSPKCLDYAYFQPKNKTEKELLVISKSSLHFYALRMEDQGAYCFCPVFHSIIL